MITWGLVVVLTAWTTGETSFYLLRFLLGVAEAGFVPGMILSTSTDGYRRPTVPAASPCSSWGRCSGRSSAARSPAC